MNNIQKLIDAVALDDKEEMANAFSAVMQDKVRTAIDVKTIETAEKIYNAEETEAEAEETLTEARIEVPADEKEMKELLDKAKGIRANERDYQMMLKKLKPKQAEEFNELAFWHDDYNGAYKVGYQAGMGRGFPKSGGLAGNNPHKKNTLGYWLWMAVGKDGFINGGGDIKDLTEAKIEIPADEKSIKAFLNNAKKIRATEKDYERAMKDLDLETFTKMDKLVRNHKDFANAYDLGYDMGMGEGLPKRGGLEGNNPHKRNTLAYHIWMDTAGQGEADA